MPSPRIARLGRARWPLWWVICSLFAPAAGCRCSPTPPPPPPRTAAWDDAPLRTAALAGAGALGAAGGATSTADEADGNATKPLAVVRSAAASAEALAAGLPDDVTEGVLAMLRPERLVVHPRPPLGIADAGEVLTPCLADLKRRWRPLRGPTLDLVSAAGRIRHHLVQQAGTLRWWRENAALIDVSGPGGTCHRAIIGVEGGPPCEAARTARMSLLSGVVSLTTAAPDRIRVLAQRIRDQGVVEFNLRSLDAGVTLRLRCDSGDHVVSAEVRVASESATATFSDGIVVLSGNDSSERFGPAQGPPQAARHRNHLTAPGTAISVSAVDVAHAALMKELQDVGFRCVGQIEIDVERTDGKATLVAIGCAVDDPVAAATPRPQAPVVAEKAKWLRLPLRRLGAAVAGALPDGRWRLELGHEEGGDGIFAARPLP